MNPSEMIGMSRDSALVILAVFASKSSCVVTKWVVFFVTPSPDVAPYDATRAFRLLLFCDSLPEKQKVSPSNMLLLLAAAFFFLAGATEEEACRFLAPPTREYSEGFCSLFFLMLSLTNYKRSHPPLLACTSRALV
eukprot:TRINITY_DN1129_c0_g8_i2.p2 TRINITY_DN1129_c0_g8~~TRINITY_DN1129_c0_g8_i2.p2  ORF type:complete len:136 (-),score=19.53 TRINITY_DN1129_c0_g8_i2:32-439(-)